MTRGLCRRRAQLLGSPDSVHPSEWASGSKQALTHFFHDTKKLEETESIPMRFHLSRRKSAEFYARSYSRRRNQE